MSTCIVMRMRNDMPLVAQTLSALALQSAPYRLFVFDNESRDGSLEEARKHTDHIVTVPRGEYVPGRVLNQAMEATDGEFVVFLNSDCTPCDGEWLANLLNGFETEQVAAVFGRQMPRTGCDPLMARDTEATYGDGSRQALWRHCFSMASSAIRRSVWEKMPFDESLRYSEDIDWTWRARQAGYLIRYVADSRVYHSHNYTLRQFHRRHYGEGCAEARIFEWKPFERSLLRYSLLPFARQVADDWIYAARRGAPVAVLRSPLLRAAQMLGRRAGFLDGFRNGENTP